MVRPGPRDHDDRAQRPLRLLLVGKGPPARDGIATFIQALEVGLGSRHDVRLVNLTRPADTSPSGGELNLSNVLRTLKDWRDVWRASAGMDVIHIHSALAPHVTLLRAGALALAGRLRGARAVVHAHGGLVKLWLTTPARRMLARVALAPADRLVAVSEGGRDALVRALGGKAVDLVDNWVDPARYLDPEPVHDPVRILYAGFITPRKGLLDLLAASTLLAARGVRHEILLAGGTPAEGPAAEEEVRAAAGDHVRFLGPQRMEAMPDLYRKADIFCLPSWWEAMPLSVLEAMAASLPVVASAVGDVPRAVETGTTGLLVPPRDPEALAAALEELARDPEKRKRMGTQGRARVRVMFGPDRALAAIEAIYLQVRVKRTKGPGRLQG